MIRLSDFPVHRHASRVASSVLFALVLLAPIVVWQEAAAAARKPNVILILADDQGSVDVHCYGAKDLITPHLDSLATRGVRFTQFYAAAPVCSPSRAGLLTGRVPQRAGVPGNAPSTRGHDGMPAEEVTIAEMLKQAGYVTGHVGKEPGPRGPLGRCRQSAPGLPLAAARPVGGPRGQLKTDWKPKRYE